MNLSDVPIYATLDENHNVIPCPDMLTWARFVDADENRLVARDVIGDARVSTVFLGLNHGFGGPALWFETMVFGGPRDGEQERYATWEEAVAGHYRAVLRERGAVGS